MKGSIIEKNQVHYTYLKEVFYAIGNIQKNYNWLITDYECYPSEIDNEKILSNKYCFISGDEITEMIEKEDLQWIWGVFSAFDKSIPLNDIIKYDMPYSDGNSSIWTNPTSFS